MIFLIILSVVGFLGILAEMLTYSIGEGGVISRFHHKYKSTNVDLVLGLLISGFFIWKGSVFIAFLAVVVFAACAAFGAVRIERRFNQEERQ